MSTPVSVKMAKSMALVIPALTVILSSGFASASRLLAEKEVKSTPQPYPPPPFGTGIGLSLGWGYGWRWGGHVGIGVGPNPWETGFDIGWGNGWPWGGHIGFGFPVDYPYPAYVYPFPLPGLSPVDRDPGQSCPWCGIPLPPTASPGSGISGSGGPGVILPPKTAPVVAEESPKP